MPDGRLHPTRGPVAQPQRALPIRVPLQVGESLDSWIEALAARNSVTPAELLTALGLGLPRTAYGLMLGLAPEALRRVERLAGLDDHALDHAVLDPYLPLGVVAPSRRALPEALWRRWTRGTGSGFCPACLAESGGHWQRRWCLRWSFACLDHQSLLAAQCHRCGGSPRSGEARWTQVAAPTLCQNADPDCARNSRSPRCYADLSTSPRRRLAHDHPLLHAQRWIDNLLCPDQVENVVELAGLTVPRTVAVEALAALIRAVLIGQHDLSQYTISSHDVAIGRRRVVDGLTVPAWPSARSVATALQAGTDPALFGIAATLAVDALRRPSLSDAADPVLRLLAGPHHRPVEIDTTFSTGLRLRPSTNGDDQADTSKPRGSSHHEGRHRIAVGDPVIDAVLLRRAASTTRLAERLSYRTANPIPRCPPSRRSTITARWPHRPGQRSSVPAHSVPQCAWPQVIDALAVTGSRRDTIAFAATVSMALVRTGTFAPWSQIALQLELPGLLARRVNAVWRNLRVDGSESSIIAALDGVVEFLLDVPPPIDYARRRSTFHRLDPIPLSTLRRACNQAGMVTTSRRHRFTAMLVWETLTGSDIRLHRGDLAPHNRADRSAYAAFRVLDAPRIAEFLAQEAERQLLRHRIKEPLTWTPQLAPSPGPRGGRAWTAFELQPGGHLSGWSAPSRANAGGDIARQEQLELSRLVREHYPLLLELISELWKFRTDRPPPRAGMAHPSRRQLYADRRGLSPESVAATLWTIRRAEQQLDIRLVETVGAADQNTQLTALSNALLDQHLYSVCGPFEFDPWARVTDNFDAPRTSPAPDRTIRDPFSLVPRLVGSLTPPQDLPPVTHSPITHLERSRVPTPKTATRGLTEPELPRRRVQM
jgi:hypothetical protein